MRKRKFPAIHAAKSTPKEPIRFSVDAAIEAAVGDGKGPRRFTMTAYNGGPLAVNGWSLPVVIALDGLGYAKSIVANKDHDSKARVGHITDKQNDGKTLVLAGVVSATGPAAKEVVDDHDNGFPWQASVEAKPVAGEVEFIAEGKKVAVNGQVFAGPLYVARKSTLYGVAFVPRGADEDTQVSIAATAADISKEAGKMDEFNKWIVAMGLDVGELTDKQKAALQTKFDAEVKAAAASGSDINAAPKFDLSEIQAAADEHSDSVDVILAEREDEVPPAEFAKIKSEARKGSRSLKSKAVSEKWTAAKYQVAAIQAASDLRIKLIEAAASHRGPAIHSSTRDATPEVIEAALCMTLKTPGHEQSFNEKTLDSAHRNFRNLGLQQLFIMAAASNGYVCRPGERIHAGNLRDVLRYAAPIHAATSTLSLSGILSNVANKELLAGYMEQDQSWREIAAIKSVTDFKQVTSYRMLDDMAYSQVGADGKIKHGTLGSESYTRQAKTYAKMYVLSRETIINDDLGALDDLRNRIGAGAAIKFNDTFWSTFMGAINAGTFFTSARGNYISGSTTNLGTDGVGLGLALKAFRQLKSPSADGQKKVGTSVGGNPSILLVSPELEGNGDKLFMGEKLNVGSGPGEENIYRNKYRPVVSPWISDSAVTGYTTTGWGLFRNPAQMASVVVSFLNGNQAPTVESADADFDQLGMQLRGYHDFGVDMAEYLAGVWSKGTN